MFPAYCRQNMLCSHQPCFSGLKRSKWDEDTGATREVARNVLVRFKE